MAEWNVSVEPHFEQREIVLQRGCATYFLRAPQPLFRAQRQDLRLLQFPDKSFPGPHGTVRLENFKNAVTEEQEPSPWSDGLDCRLEARAFNAADRRAA